jgi:hypothetical protein
VAVAEVKVPLTEASGLVRPIFVVGFSRSGTTLVQALLGAHPRIAAPPEMHFLQRIAQLGDYWGDLADDAVFRRVITETVQPPIPWLERCGFEPDRIFERAREGPRTYAAVLDAVLSDFAEREGKARWSEKTPRQQPGPIWRHFPTAQVVHVVRDPRPTVASTMAKLGAFSDAVTAARAWKQFTTLASLAGARRGPSQYLRIRYEDLSREPEPVLRLVFTFLGEDFDPGVVTDLSRRRTAVPEGTGALLEPVLAPISAPDDSSWRTVLSRWQRARVGAVVADSCPPLGYEAPQQSAVYAGRVLNVLHAPADMARARRHRRSFAAMTPEMRYQYTLREQVERVQRGADRRAATPAGET